MAVYTKYNQDEIDEILSNYDLGKLETFKGIEEGIENTNYFISTKNKKYILTVYEKRVKSKDLPFFSKLMSFLDKANFKCPVPILNKKKETITNYNGKELMVVSFLEGKAKQNLSPTNCESIGVEVAKMHEITKNFKLKRENDLSIKSWRGLFETVKDQCSQIHKDLPKLISENLNDVEKKWPSDLPKGIIHADLFHDNIFFLKNEFSGIIDFYFSCEDYFAFEIAVCFNALCFEGVKENLSFNVTKAKKFIDGYSSIRKLSDQEKANIKVLSQGASLRFLLTRVFDALNTVEGAMVKVKDPIEYLKRLEFHKKSKSYEDYFF
jgi:homoserine kinase type II